MSREKEAEPLREKTLWVMPPQVLYSWSAPGPVRYRVAFQFLSVHPELEAAVTERGGLEISLTDDQVKQVQGLAEGVAPSFAKPDTLSVFHFQRALAELSLLAMSSLPRKQLRPMRGHAKERTQRAIAWFKAHIREKPTLDAIAGAVHVSTSQLRRDFYEASNESPKAALDRLRIERAKEILTLTDLTLDEVGNNAGFASASDLCRVFNKLEGKSPAYWRRHISERESSASE